MFMRMLHLRHVDPAAFAPINKLQSHYKSLSEQERQRFRGMAAAANRFVAPEKRMESEVRSGGLISTVEGFNPKT